MEIKLNLYEIVYNGGLGTCHLLKKKNGGCMTHNEVYLFYSETNPEHFIVCEGVSDSGYFHYARYCTSLESALKVFKEIK